MGEQRLHLGVLEDPIRDYSTTGCHMVESKKIYQWIAGVF